MRANFRRWLRRERNSKLVMVRCNPSGEVLQKRIAEAENSKDMSVFVRTETKSRQDAYERQKTYFQSPTADEADAFFEIKEEKDMDSVVQQVHTTILG